MPLPVLLTEEELQERAAELARTVLQRDTLADKLLETGAELRRQIKALTRKISAMSREYREGKEERLVEVEVKRNAISGTVTVTRLDTDEVVSRRALTADEQQGRLFPDPVLEDAQANEGEEAPTAKKRKRGGKSA